MTRRTIALTITRRHLLIAAAAFTGYAGTGAHNSVRADGVSPQYREALEELARGRQIREGRIELTVPRLAESGNSVSLRATIESPMTESDHVRAVHILSERNPVAKIAQFNLGPRAGRAEIATNIRLATTQDVHAIAEMSDGSLWHASANVVVLVAACVDGG